MPNPLQKFINETYHIENELICQLHPNKFDLIPDFIIEACDQYHSIVPNHSAEV